MNPGIFREYDIRGLVDQDLTAEVVQLLGQAFAAHLALQKKRRVVIARDGRLSSPALRESLLNGLQTGGLEVLDLGLCPTPVFYFSLFHLDREGGIMITGSHNPAEFNGFKVCVGKETIYGKEIQNLRRLMETRAFVRGDGSWTSFDILPAYRDFLLQNIQLKRKMKVAVDSGNGSAGVVAPQILQDLGCEVTALYSEVDGRFPHHHPDPTIPENMRDLIRTVKETGAEVGIGYDGDADRIGVVDHLGNIIWGDQLLILFSRQILRRHPGATIISEVKCSQNLFDDIARHGGRGIMWKAGHSLLKSKMKAEKALLGGEMSGHIVFADRYFGFDDAIYASCRLLEILSEEEKSIPELLSDLPPVYNTPEIRVPCPDEKKFDLVQRLKESFRREYPIVAIDGVRVLFPDGWGLVRASNTQPVLVLRFEARSPERLQEIQALVEKRVEEVTQ
jgi:phosphomannomutase/phosphoglucomutase